MQKLNTLANNTKMSKKCKKNSCFKGHRAIFIYLAILLLVLIPSVSAIDWDNSKNVLETIGDAGYKNIQIENRFGWGEVLWDGSLKSNTETCAEDCEAIQIIELTNEGSLVDKIKFETILNNGDIITEPIISYKFYVRTAEEPLWKEYELGSKMPIGIYEVKLVGEKDSEKTVDWIIQSQGRWLSEWALWSPWIIEGNKVYVDDDYVYISAEPHTINKDDWVVFNITSKVYTGNADFVLGVDNSNKPTKLERFNPQEVSMIMNYTCTGDSFNFTTSPNYAWCYNGTEVIFEHSFDSGNIPLQTISWEESYIRDWEPINAEFNSLDYNYGGMNKWWYKTDVPIVQDVEYLYRVYIDTSGKGKYWFAIKPSGETIPEAITSGHLYALDPWVDTIYEYYDLNDRGSANANGVGTFGQNFK